MREIKVLPPVKIYDVTEEAGHAPDDVSRSKCVQFQVRDDGLIKMPGMDTWFDKDGLKKYFEFCSRAVDKLPIILCLFLLMGCQSPKVVTITPNPPKAIELPSISQAIIVARQPAGYEVNMAGGTLVIITNGPNKGSQIFFGTSQQPTWTTLHCLKAASITVQGSNDLANWSDLWTTNAPDFYFKFDPKYLFYRTRS